MEMVLEIGVENIAAELLRKRALARARVAGQRLHRVERRCQTGKRQRHHVIFFSPDKDLAALHQKLSDAGIVASLRTDRKGQNYIRLSPHFYNTDAELQRVLELG